MLARPILQLVFSSIVIAAALPASGAKPHPLPDTLGRIEELLVSGSGSDIDAAVVLSCVQQPSPEVERTEELLRRLCGELRLFASRRLDLPDELHERSVARLRDLLATMRSKLRLLGVDLRQQPLAAALVVPENDDCGNALAISAGTLSGSTVGATNDGSASCGASPTSPDVWYAYTASNDEVVVWDTFGSAMDTVLSVHVGCPGAVGHHELTCSDDSRGSLTSLVVHEMTAGETVLVRLSGAAGATGSYTLSTQTSPAGIAGRVVKAATGEVLGGVKVDLVDEDGFLFDATLTEADGRYLFASVDAGTWFLKAGDGVFVAKIWDDRVCLSSDCPVAENGDAVELVSGIVDDIDFALDPGGTIEGTVVREATGLPTSASLVAHFPDGTLAGTGGTNGDGRYRISGLPSGSYAVRVVGSPFLFNELYDDLPCHGSCDLSQATPVVVAAGSTTSAIDFALRGLGRISGSVVSARDGSPVTAFVELFTAMGDSLQFAFTGFDGNYTTIDLPPGDYFLRTINADFLDELYDDQPCEPSCDPTTGTAVPVELETETSGIDFVLDEAGRIGGRVRAADTGESIAADILLFDEGGVFVSSASVVGGYQFAGLLPGLYYVRASTGSHDPGYEDQVYRDLGCDPDCDVTTGTPVAVHANVDTTGIDFHLARCDRDSHRLLADLTVDDRHDEEACRTIRVGPGVTIDTTGELHLRAGRSVVFHDGFKVSTGGRLEVRVDPAVGSN